MVKHEGLRLVLMGEGLKLNSVCVLGVGGGLSEKPDHDQYKAEPAGQPSGPSCRGVEPAANTRC